MNWYEDVYISQYLPLDPYPTPKKTKATQPKTPQGVQGRDLFQTPNYATDLLIPYIPKSVKWVWEPATGEGKIADKLRHHHYGAIDTDLRGTLYKGNFNFLTEWYVTLQAIYGIDHDLECIITNPPFSLKREFYERCVGYGVPFALLIPADYSGWIIKAKMAGAESIIPTRRIDYITPTGKSGAGGHSADFHSMWLTKGFNLGKSEVFVELSLKDKENI